MGTTFSRVLGLAALAGLATFTAAACGGSGSGGGGGGGGAPEHPASLVGNVGQGDAFTISMTDPQGHQLGTVAAGSYQLTVHDDSSIHNFPSTGTGVDDATSGSAAETKTFTVKLSPGTYTFICDAHPTSMKGTFQVK
jgi:plastocyanin